MEKKMPFNNTTVITPKDINILTTRWEKRIRGTEQKKNTTNATMSEPFGLCIEFAWQRMKSIQQ